MPTDAKKTHQIPQPQTMYNKPPRPTNQTSAHTKLNTREPRTKITNKTPPIKNLTRHPDINQHLPTNKAYQPESQLQKGIAKEKTKKPEYPNHVNKHENTEHSSTHLFILLYKPYLIKISAANHNPTHTPRRLRNKTKPLKKYQNTPHPEPENPFTKPTNH